MKKKRHKKESVYRLHIDAVPLPGLPAGRWPAHATHGATVVHGHAAISPQSSHLMHVARNSRRGKVWAFIWDKVQFILVSVVVFFAIYVVMNWQALFLNITHYWNVWRGFESPLTTLVETKTAAPEKLAVIGSDEPASTVIPPLNIEIFPPDMRLIIPRINQNVPVVGVRNENLIARQWDELEADIQNALRNGVIHYPGTALPGDNGNIVITGHSSYYAWDPGRFKDVFALLHDVKMGDKIVMYFNQKKFIYQVDNIKVVLPKDVDVLAPSSREQLTLITCTPIGTNLKRLIVTAKLVLKN